MQVRKSWNRKYVNVFKLFNKWLRKERGYDYTDKLKIQTKSSHCISIEYFGRENLLSTAGYQGRWHVESQKSNQNKDSEFLTFFLGTIDAKGQIRMDTHYVSYTNRRYHQKKIYRSWKLEVVKILNGVISNYNKTLLRSLLVCLLDFIHPCLGRIAAKSLCAVLVNCIFFVIYCFDPIY